MNLTSGISKQGQWYAIYKYIKSVIDRLLFSQGWILGYGYNKS